MRFKDREETPEDFDLMKIPRHALHAIALKAPDFPILKAPLPEDLRSVIGESFSHSEVEDLIDRSLSDYFRA
jgi:hypothetical protein